MCHNATIKEVKAMLFSIDASSDKDYFLILKDGKEYVRVNKRVNTLEAVKKYFQIDIVK